MRNLLINYKEYLSNKYFLFARFKHHLRYLRRSSRCEKKNEIIYKRANKSMNTNAKNYGTCIYQKDPNYRKDHGIPERPYEILVFGLVCIMYGMAYIWYGIYMWC